MKLGFIGLGKMGLNMVHRLLLDEHKLFVYNRSTEPLREAEKLGAKAFKSVDELVGNLEGRKVIWLMIPSGKPVDENACSTPK